MNLLQEKILKAWTKKEWHGCDFCGGYSDREEVKKEVKKIIEEVYKAGKEEAGQLQKMSNDINNAKTY